MLDEQKIIHTIFASYRWQNGYNLIVANLIQWRIGWKKLHWEASWHVRLL